MHYSWGANYRLHCTDCADWVLDNTHHLHNCKVQLLWWMHLTIAAIWVIDPTLNWACSIEFCQWCVISVKSTHCDSYLLYIAFEKPSNRSAQVVCRQYVKQFMHHSAWEHIINYWLPDYWSSELPCHPNNSHIYLQSHKITAILEFSTTLCIKHTSRIMQPCNIDVALEIQIS